MVGFAELLEYSFEAVKPSIEKMLRENYSDIEKYMENHIFDFPGPTKPPGPLYSEHSKDFEFFNIILEIHSSLEHLEDIGVIVRRFPYGGTRISKSRHLQTTIEEYFNEIYILKERVKRLSDTLQKRYRRKGNIDAANRIGHAMQRFSRSLSKATSIRGQHVHVARLNQRSLSRISTLELLSQFGPAPYKGLYDEAYREARKTWTKLIETTNESLVKYLDQYCDSIFSLAFPHLQSGTDC